MRLMVAVLAVLLMAGMIRAEEGRLLNEAEADQVLETLFQKARQIERVQATMVMTQEGGFARDALKRYAEVKFQTPARAWILGREESEKPLPFEQSSLTLFDGRYLWELMPQYEPGTPREATRRQLRDEDAATADEANLAVFLLGSQVASARELRAQFEEIEVRALPGEHHIRLKPREKAVVIELWFPETAAVPRKIRTTETKKVFSFGGGNKTTTSVQTRELQDVRTNLDGLPPFPTETFVFPYGPGVAVIDDETGEPIPPATLQADLAAIRQRLAQKPTTE